MQRGPRPRDPRSTRRYIESSRDWLASLAAAGDTAPCALCPGLVDLSLPRTHPTGPTVEHTLPIRTILAITETWADAVELCCDTNLWAVAHRRCQDRQGAAASRRPRRRPSRAW